MLASLGMQRFDGEDLADASSLALFMRLMVGNVALAMHAALIGQLTRFLGGYAVSAA